MKAMSLIALVLASACATSAPPAATANPCVLLAEDDISAAQGERPVRTQMTSHTSGGVTVSQCFFLLPDQSRSVTLELTAARSVRKLWEKQFEPGEEKESGETHAIEVKDLGRDAFWGGNRVSGSLYVLSRDAIVKISIGGSGDASTKMERAKELARRALARLE